MHLPWTDGLLVTRPGDAECIRLADRHYSRQTSGAPLGSNGRKLVLRDTAGLVVFVWMYPALERWDQQTGFYNLLFRNESDRPSSAIIREAETQAVAVWGPNRAYTYIDPRKVQSRNPGYCFKCAGWSFVKVSTRGKHLLEKWLS